MSTQYLDATSKIVTSLNGENGDVKVSLDKLGLKELLDQKSDTTHTHLYASSMSVGGPAIRAKKLTVNCGTTNTPIYVCGENDGVNYPTAISHTIDKSVPSDAEFTDTTYDVATNDTYGVIKLYNRIGANTDGTLTQNSIRRKFSYVPSKSVMVNVVLYASQWTGTEIPYTYTLTITGVTENSNQDIIYSDNNTIEELFVLESANLQDGGQSENTIVLKAFGGKPVIDLPIRIIMRNDGIPKEPPILMANTTWYKGTIAKSSIEQIDIKNRYSPSETATESWNADVNDSGYIKVYIEGTKLTIAGNGAELIVTNEDSSNAFASFTNVTQINGLDILDTGETTDVSGMFSDCAMLTSVDTSTWDTNIITICSSMFSGCTNLINVNLGKWSVTDSSYMFNNCTSLHELDLSVFNTTNATNMDGMFNGCSGLNKIILGASFKFVGTNCYLSGDWYDTSTKVLYAPEELANVERIYTVTYTTDATYMQSDWEESDVSSTYYVKNKPALSGVAFTGSYNDLTDTSSMIMRNNQFVELLSQKQDKSTQYTMTLSATNWVGTDAPYTYGEYLELGDYEILPAIPINTDQLEQLQVANICLDVTESNVKLIAIGDKPTIDINIRIIRR